MATTPKTLTYEEWLRLPETEGIEEVVNGEIRKLPPHKAIHADTVENLADLLKEKLDRRTVRVRVSNFGLVIHRDPVTTRVPDIAVFIREKEMKEDGYFHSPPELVVEVLSPSNTRAEREKSSRITRASVCPKSGWCRRKRRRSRCCCKTAAGHYFAGSSRGSSAHTLP